MLDKIKMQWLNYLNLARATVNAARENLSVASDTTSVLPWNCCVSFFILRQRNLLRTLK
jgi:hypothetical protein